MDTNVADMEMVAQIQFAAMYDDLTGLPNRALFQDRLNQSVKFSQRNRFKNEEKWKIVVMLIDLDNFQFFNSHYGCSQGDFIVQQIADRIQKVIRKSDTVARIEGGKFMLIFANVTCKKDVDFLGRKMMRVFSEPFQLSEECVQTTASIGISYFPDDGEDCQSLMQAADIAMNRAKRKHNCYRIFGDCEKQRG